MKPVMQSPLPDEPVSDPTSTGPVGGTWRQTLRDALETAVLALVLFFGISALTARIRVESVSMVPTLHPGDFVVVNKLAYKLGEPQQGDIVVFRLSNNPAQRYIKRLIGLPGDTVRVAGGDVYINGHLLSEPYLPVRTNRGGTWEVPPGSIFVMGDNRNNSSDSRSFGPVSLEQVIGKAVFIYWPPQDWGMLNQAAFAAQKR